MKIQKISIHNYRSIRDLDFQCEPMVILLGPNNHGKSNILSAIEFALSPGAKPSQSDFNAFCGGEYLLWVEVTFHELTEQEKTTFRKYLRQDGNLCIRKTATINDGGKLEISLNGYCQEPDLDWLRSSEVPNLAKRDVINACPLKDYVPAAGRVTQDSVRDAQRRYIEEHETEITYRETLEKTSFLGPANIGGGVLPDFYLVPAVRDLTDELKTKALRCFMWVSQSAVCPVSDISSS